MTSESCQTGTERILEVSKQLSKFELYVNIQGDEPLITSYHIDKLCELMCAKVSSSSVGTLALPIINPEEVNNPSICKVVFDHQIRAIYFSRSPIPYVRENNPEVRYQHYKHMGLYCYTYEFLQELPNFKRSTLEEYESLEQLRWIYNGVPIYLGFTSRDTVAIDTPEDLERVRQILKDS